ncbi:hypothetical protein ABZP36_006614 [Zizania latifolia]
MGVGDFISKLRELSAKVQTAKILPKKKRRQFQYSHTLLYSAHPSTQPFTCYLHRLIIVGDEDDSNKNIYVDWSKVEVNVRMDCEGCERKVRKVLEDMKGVGSIEVDVKQNKATMARYVEQ